MDISFDCTCGGQISEFTRGEDGDVKGIRIACTDCGARYAVTITQIRGSTA